MKPQAELDALVEAEELAGGSMTVPAPAHLIKTGKVIVATKPSGNWQADCTQCGAGCGAAGAPALDDELDTEALDYEQRMLEDFTDEHADCQLPADDGKDLPSPTAMPAPTSRSKTTWIVRGTNGSDLHILAEWHTTYARPEGTELRFFNLDGDDRHRVATVRAGSWHWVTAESALEPTKEQK